MREEVIKVYQFEELTKEVQEKIIERFRTSDNYLDYEWYEGVFDFYHEKAKKLGLYDTDFSFSGFWSQGDGAGISKGRVDIEKAIESVSELKCGFQIVTVKNSKAVVTVPMEKNETVDDIIKMASENDGWIGYSICFNKKGMKQIEFENAIKTLLNHGVAWEDKQNFIKNQTKNDNIIYWFPGLNSK